MLTAMPQFAIIHCGAALCWKIAGAPTLGKSNLVPHIYFGLG